MPRTPSSDLRRRRLGLELRRLRETTGLTGEQVVERVGWAAKSKLSRLENGRSRPDLADIMDLLDLYEVDARTRDELVTIARDAGNARWLRTYPVMTARQRGWAELEATCTLIREYAATTVPGLLQTPDYARIRILSTRSLGGVPVQRPIAGAEEVELEISARLARQSILTRENDPANYAAVLDEAALIGRGAPPEVLREQLSHLGELARLPNVTLLVLPCSTVVGAHYQPQHAFSTYDFADPGDQSTVAVEALGNDMILTDRTIVRTYAQVFGLLSRSALGPGDSLQWISAAASAVRP
ncbi:transcriptional regulator with XRE-family HTH domain [Allocatelliglobosispora scoriae]|uniref:Transcriptional regulator with XRE-family HTH domain n=1 Tax=Allocatelliglobosispora scoriae TaxID=643052 RepID=A0A841BRL8_9ACTN|nr:transcriptional regulator with XRE-family HTH domain [Allocatelliglobosispora scoriae]